MARCFCGMYGADGRCRMGLYLVGKLLGVNEVTGVKGFLDLSDYTRQRILGERQRWLEEYNRHVWSEGVCDESVSCGSLD